MQSWFLCPANVTAVVRTHVGDTLSAVYTSMGSANFETIMAALCAICLGVCAARVTSTFIMWVKPRISRWCKEAQPVNHEKPIYSGDICCICLEPMIPGNLFEFQCHHIVHAPCAAKLPLKRAIGIPAIDLNDAVMPDLVFHIHIYLSSKCPLCRQTHRVNLDACCHTASP